MVVAEKDQDQQIEKTEKYVFVESLHFLLGIDHHVLECLPYNKLEKWYIDLFETLQKEGMMEDAEKEIMDCFNNRSSRRWNGNGDYLLTTG
ncbi:hypothetical protein [Listeria booriae]|uniref:Uncharacterized protein n=1 Tax=Listeria booriae TaxID=1552123 RepID=A0A7X0WGS3_9LIST|nr:hypothetical protein [Listeria booriae]MBC1333477.1 hypothetical protein [Listeria booriae]MBC2388782.1 hypothetical protein [Listeria booriae]